MPDRPAQPRSRRTAPHHDAQSRNASRRTSSGRSTTRAISSSRPRSARSHNSRALPDRYIGNVPDIQLPGGARRSSTTTAETSSTPSTSSIRARSSTARRPIPRNATSVSRPARVRRAARGIVVRAGRLAPEHQEFLPRARPRLKPRAMTRDIEPRGVPVPVDGYPEERNRSGLVRRRDRLPLCRRQWAASRGTPEAWRDWWSPSHGPLLLPWARTTSCSTP